MKVWQEYGEALRRYINPSTYPVAVRFLRDLEEAPPGARSPGKDLQVKLAHCQAQAITRKYGWWIFFRPVFLRPPGLRSGSGAASVPGCRPRQTGRWPRPGR